MDLLKTPHQMLLEEQGAHIDGQGLLMTPKQKMFQEMGVVPKFSKGKQVRPLTPEDMKAELFIQRNKLAAGGQPSDPTSHPELVKAFNAYFK